MRNKKFMGVIALVMFAVLAFVGSGYAEEFGWPVPGYSMSSITTTYYYSSGAAHSCRYYYNGRAAGIDIAVPTGTNVYAVAAGTVQSLEDKGNTSFGKYFEIKHTDGTITLYAHLSQFKVQNGQSVKRGDLIALSGSTGNSTGPHLHFEMSNRDTYQYYRDNGCRDPRYIGNYDELPVSQGLRNLTSSRYAKVFTLTSGRYYNLYSNSELTNRLSSSAWTGENDEDWITGVGVNSKNVVYARISYPVSGGRREAYASLRELFVRGTENGGIIKAQRNGYGLYKRLDSGRNYSYGIDAGDECYLLTKENGWYQVMYPITGRNYWRIAWMPESVYNYVFPPDPNPIYPPVITSLTNIPAQIVAGNYFSGRATATGTTPITWKTSSGTLPSSASHCRLGLPPGLSISGTGTTAMISGYPSHNSSGQSSHLPLYYYFNVNASNSYGSSSPKSSYLVVWEPPVFETSANLPATDVGRYYNQTISAKGTEFTMTWKIIEGKLPPGLTFNASSNKRTATITGYPQHTGVFKFKVRLYNLVGNSNTTTTREFTINVGNVAAEYKDSRISFRYNVMNGRTGTNYSDWTGVIDSMSGTKSLSNYIFLVSDGELPPGLYLEEQSSSYYSAGKVYLKGVPSKAGTYNFTIKAKRINDGGYNTKDFTVRIDSSSSSAWRNSSMYTNWYFLSGKMQVSYRDCIRVNGGSSPYTPSLVKGELPPGTRLEQSGAYTYLTGVPKQNGTFNFTVRITGSNNGYVEKACSVYIANNPYYKSGGSTSTSKPKFPSKVMPDAYVGSMWEATLDATGAEPIAWSAAEPLPEWMTLEEDTGRIFGIPMEKGKYKFRITAENELGQVTKTFKVKVLRASPTIITSSLPEGYTGVAYETYLEAQGTDPIKWSKIGKLPSGLKLNKKDGIISGTPKRAGEYPFTLKAKNKAGTETIPMTIIIHQSAEESADKDAEEEEPEEEDEDNGTETPESKSSLPSTLNAQPESQPAQNGSAGVLTALYALSGDERLEGSLNTEAGKDLAFEIGAWTDEYGRAANVSGVAVFIDDAPISADISPEGIFTLDGENVHGDFTVYAVAQYEERELKTEEISVSAFAHEDSVNLSESDTISASGVEAENNSGSESSASGGCSLSLLGVAGMLLCVNVIRGKKR